MEQSGWSPKDLSILGALAVFGAATAATLAFVGHVIGEARAGSLWEWLLDFPYGFQVDLWFLAGAAMGALLAAGPKLVRGWLGGGAARRAGGSR